MEIILGIAAFAIGYLFCDFTTEQRRKDMVKAGNKIFETNSYFVLCELSQMHDLGLKALNLAHQKCLEIDETKKEEYEKFITVFDKRMNEFGELYMVFLKKTLTTKTKYNTYKEVKENFHNLFNDEVKTEENKNA